MKSPEYRIGEKVVINNSDYVTVSYVRIQSTGYIYGFSNSWNWYEKLSNTGTEVRKATKEEIDLFYMQ